MVNEVETELRRGGGWARKPWCFWLAVGLVLLGACSNIVYLWHNCPLDFSGDESHYWEWSRHLDYGYYSKPPGIAWVLWLAERVGAWCGLATNSGAALMPILRMPAVLFGSLSGIISLLLARRMFRDDRAALAVILLSAAVPMFAVGSLLITIDAPMYLCWAASVYCLWRVVDPGHRGEGIVRSSSASATWLYAAGLCCAAGMLFKPVLIAVPLCAVIAAIGDPLIRRSYKTWHALGALGLFVLLQVPTILWNTHHGWVMYRHIATQGGFTGEGESGSKVVLAAKHFGEFLGGQAGGMGGILFVLLVIAAITMIRQVRHQKTNSLPPVPTVAAFSHARGVFLLSFTLPLWCFYLLLNLWTKTEVNWPAASYFTGMILLAGVLVQGWTSAVPRTRWAWRVWGTAVVVWGILLSAAAMNLQRLYPLAARHLEPLQGTPRYDKSLFFPGRWDPAMKMLRGMRERAAAVGAICQQVREETGQEPLVIAGRYDTSSSLAFYLPGQPFVFSIMSIIGGRHNQYDLWPGLNERNAAGELRYAGRPAVLVDETPESRAIREEVLQPAFDRVGPPQDVPIYVEGVLIKHVSVVRAYGFMGLPASATGKY
jgi:4-amino-4-deoxy-L-arabinose transferase-like glycosyltransferase